MTTKGIQYFPLDVNFFEDDKIAVIINDYGFEAVGVTLKLFSQIYKNGFYMNWKFELFFNKNQPVGTRFGQGVCF